tara:strand:+ start:168 stop:503 length:336 start_codon:yes stop_codon:yes gene_type:complete
MSKIIENLSGKIQDISNRVAKDGKKYIQSAVSKGEEISHKGKIQLEIEKLKWELKQNYNKLGKYVAKMKISKSVTDFSHDSSFLQMVNDINKLQLFIDERKKEKLKKTAEQ